MHHTTPPDVSGWYWVRFRSGISRMCYYNLTKGSKSLCVVESCDGVPIPWRVPFPCPMSLAVEWSGPIVNPFAASSANKQEGGE